MQTNKSWTLTLEEDPDTGDLMLPLPEECLQDLGWNTGDTVQWIDNQDGSWTLKKKE